MNASQGLSYKSDLREIFNQHLQYAGPSSLHLAGDTIELPYGWVTLHGCRPNGFIAVKGEPIRPLIPGKKCKRICL